MWRGWLASGSTSGLRSDKSVANLTDGTRLTRITVLGWTFLGRGAGWPVIRNPSPRIAVTLVYAGCGRMRHEETLTLERGSQ